MKLYLYDHCPFCTRVRMPLGLKSISAEEVYLANDDEETPIGMIGAKMVPILEDADGHMAESLDIVAKLDGLSGERLFDAPPQDELLTWMRNWAERVSTLVIPRAPDPVFPEFATESARAYFTAKKTASLGDFDQLRARTDEYIADMTDGLRDLVSVLPDAAHPSSDDIHIFPVLRSLTIVDGLEFPDEVEAYTRAMSKASGVPLVWDLR
ncbi:glutaredoxin 2 [Ferrimonas balearica]|nr:glutaredoxin 2 [Ferrimonas balearica]